MTDQGARSVGLFITFEGGDGAGKTTQLERVRAWFEEQGRPVLVTREPGGTELGLDLRRLIQHGPEDVDPRTEALLYAADRAYHVATVVRPALAEGTVVLGDRYIDSSVAYQGAARDLGVEEVLSLSRWATRGLQPQLTFLLDLPPEVGARRGTGEPDRIERESADFHERVRHEYLNLAEAHPERIVVIDAVGTPDQVFSEIKGVLEERLPALVDGGDPRGGATAPGTADADEDATVGTPGTHTAEDHAGATADAPDGAAGTAEDEPTRDARGDGAATGHRSPERSASAGEGLMVLTEAQATLWGDPDQDMLL